MFAEEVEGFEVTELDGGVGMLVRRIGFGLEVESS